MTAEQRIVAAKIFAITGFLVLLVITYWLRSEVLGLSRIRFSAEEKRFDWQLQQNRDSFPELQKQYQVELINYDLRKKHYERMMAVYQKDLDEYARLSKDNLEPPQQPRIPSPPTPPEVAARSQEIQGEFALRRHRFFVTSEYGNWIACAASLSLVGGLLYLLMFDVNTNRLYYYLTLVLSFVFLIGPSLHSIMSAIVGVMHSPHGF